MRRKRNNAQSEPKSKSSSQRNLLIFIYAIIFVGLIGPFLAQCCLSICNTDANIKGLEMWNQYVGIILGVVATVLSIVSLNMGFQSAAEASAQQRQATKRYEESLRMMMQLTGKVERIGEKVGLQNEPSVMLKTDSASPQVTQPSHVAQSSESANEEDRCGEANIQSEEPVCPK